MNSNRPPVNRLPIASEVDDLAGFRVSGPIVPKRRGSRRSKRRGRFLRGPIPMDWLEMAMRLPGSALHVGMMLWHFKGLRKSDTFKISLAELTCGVICRDTVRRGLNNLETARLASVVRQRGRKLKVTILSGPAAVDTEDPENEYPN